MALHHKKSHKNIWAPASGTTRRDYEGPPSKFASPERVPDEGFINMLLGAAAIAGEINRLESEPTTPEESEATTEES